MVRVSPSVAVFSYEGLERVGVRLGERILDFSVRNEVGTLRDAVIELSPNGQLCPDAWSAQLDAVPSWWLPDSRNGVKRVSADEVLSPIVEFLDRGVVLGSTDTAVDRHVLSLTRSLRSGLGTGSPTLDWRMLTTGMEVRPPRRLRLPRVDITAIADSRLMAHAWRTHLRPLARSQSLPGFFLAHDALENLAYEWESLTYHVAARQ